MTRELHIDACGLALAAVEHGDPQAPPLLALHGWLDNAGSFARLAPLLASRWRVIALELPGHGHSAHVPPSAGYHYVEYVRAVLAAADALKLPRYHLLGHSLGAGVAALVASAQPQCIQRLSLIEGLGPLGDDGTHTLQRFRDAFAAPPPRRRGPRIFKNIEQAVDARVAAGGLSAPLARPIVERGLIACDGGWRWRSDPRLRRSSPIRLAEAQVHALLAGIEAPVSLLLARPSAPYLPEAPMRARAACVTDIRVEHLDGGHHLHLEQPQEVAAWLAH